MFALLNIVESEHGKHSAPFTVILDSLRQITSKLIFWRKRSSSSHFGIERPHIYEADEKRKYPLSRCGDKILNRTSGMREGTEE